MHIICPKTILSLSGEYIIKPQEKICTLTHDNIQPKGLMISTTLRAVMICQTCGLDKKSRIKTIRLFWCTLRDSPWPNETLPARRCNSKLDPMPAPGIKPLARAANYESDSVIRQEQIYPYFIYSLTYTSRILIHNVGPGYEPPYKNYKRKIQALRLGFLMVHPQGLPWPNETLPARRSNIIIVQKACLAQITRPERQIMSQIRL